MELFDLLLYKSVAGDSGGGGVDPESITLVTLNVSQNGTTNAPSGKAYNKVVANVPNTYGASDEGKVVSNGSLVAQTAHAEVTANGTIDTTLNNSVVVNVPKTIDGITSIKLSALAGTEIDLDLPDLTTLANCANGASQFAKIGIHGCKPTSMYQAFYIVGLDRQLTEIDLTGVDFSECTTYYWAFENRTVLVSIIGELDFSAASNVAEIFYGCRDLQNVRFVANTLSVSMNISQGGNYAPNSLNKASLVSIANGLKAVADATLTLTSGAKSICNSTMGAVAQIGSGDGAYDFFTEEESGTTSLMDFITNTKGWTVA